MGIKLKEKLFEALGRFESVMMLTLTIDPELFHSPEGAYRYVRGERCISGLVRELHRKGWLRSKRFFYVVEFQPSGNPHWHLLVDTDYVPFDALTLAWNRYIPKGIDPEKCRAGLGGVDFRKQPFADASHAAHYVAKYVTKAPEGGFPAWAYHFRGDLRRYGVSRGFWSADGSTSKRFTDGSRVGRLRRRRRTVAEQLARCGKRAVIIACVEVRQTADKIKKHYRFVSELSTSFKDAVSSMSLELLTARRASISRDQIKQLTFAARPS